VLFQSVHRDTPTLSELLLLSTGKDKKNMFVISRRASIVQSVPVIMARSP